MKLALATEKEYDKLWAYMRELKDLTEQIHNQLHHWDNLDVLKLDEGDFPVLSKFSTNNTLQFICNLCDEFEALNFAKVMFNAVTIFQNCADENQDVLDFKPNIKNGLELLEEINKPDNIIVDRYNDDGSFSHRDVLNGKTGEVVWKGGKVG